MYRILFEKEVSSLASYQLLVTCIKHLEYKWMLHICVSMINHVSAAAHYCYVGKYKTSCCRFYILIVTAVILEKTPSPAFPFQIQWYKFAIWERLVVNRTIEQQKFNKNRFVILLKPHFYCTICKSHYFSRLGQLLWKKRSRFCERTDVMCRRFLCKHITSAHPSE